MEKEKLLFTMQFLLSIVAIIVLGFASALTGHIIQENTFNLEIEVPETYTEVLAGENIWFTTKLLNLANTQRMDVLLTYEILDINQELKAAKTETVAIETQASFVGNLKVPVNLEKGIYFLRVVLISPLGKAEAETLFQVIEDETSKQILIKISLFDIRVTIPEAYKKISPGDELLTNIKLVNLGGAGRVDVFLEYFITDSEQKTILKNTETVAIETQTNLVRIFDLPSNLKPGTYQFYAKIIYGDGKEALANHSFEVIIRQKDNRLYYYVLAGLLFLIGLIYIFLKLKPLLEKYQMKIKIARIVKKRQL